VLGFPSPRWLIANGRHDQYSSEDREAESSKDRQICTPFLDRSGQKDDRVQYLIKLSFWRYLDIRTVYKDRVAGEIVVGIPVSRLRFGAP
jgi:hypothetical protein